MVRYQVARMIPTRAQAPRPDGRLDNPLTRRLVAHAQRIIEGQHHAMRSTLRRYTDLPERQRLMVQARRAEAMAQLTGVERRLTVLELDRRWSAHMERMADLREAAHLERLGGRDPVLMYNKRVDEAFSPFFDEVQAAVREALAAGPPPPDDRRLQGPTATWTYLVDDNPFDDRIGLAMVGNIGLAAVAALVAWPLLLIWSVYRWSRRS